MILLSFDPLPLLLLPHIPTRSSPISLQFRISSSALYSQDPILIAISSHTRIDGMIKEQIIRLSWSWLWNVYMMLLVLKPKGRDMYSTKEIRWQLEGIWRNGTKELIEFNWHQTESVGASSGWIWRNWQREHFNFQRNFGNSITRFNYSIIIDEYFGKVGKMI